MREMRWQFGAVLPEEVKLNLSEPELEYFSKYRVSFLTGPTLKITSMEKN